MFGLRVYLCGPADGLNMGYAGERMEDNHPEETTY